MLQMKWGGITTKPYPTYEVKDLIHNTQEIDKKIVGINNTTRFSLKSLDAPYLDAIARGNMATAERLVREAANKYKELNLPCIALRFIARLKSATPRHNK